MSAGLAASVLPAACLSLAACVWLCALRLRFGLSLFCAFGAGFCLAAWLWAGYGA